MNRLQQLRKEHSLTQDDLAAKLHLKRSVISKYENGMIPLTDTLIRELSDIFQVSTDYLLGNSDTPNPQTGIDGQVAMTPDGIVYKGKHYTVDDMPPEVAAYLKYLQENFLDDK